MTTSFEQPIDGRQNATAVGMQMLFPEQIQQVIGDGAGVILLGLLVVALRDLLCAPRLESRRPDHRI
jgi:hypothetical protein